MALFEDLKYNQYIPQYVGQPLGEFLQTSTTLQDRFNKVSENYSLIGELSDQLQSAPMDSDLKDELNTYVDSYIRQAAQRGDFDQMQNEMRNLAKIYSKQASPLQENLRRYQASKDSIAKSELPQATRNYLLNQLSSQPGIGSFEEPNYLNPISFAENVDLKKVYEDFITGYKSDKYPGGIRSEIDPSTGLVEYYSNTTNELVDPNEVQEGLINLAISDPKAREFILQEGKVAGINIDTPQKFAEFAAPLINAYANKAGFFKQDLDFKLGHADAQRMKEIEDKLGAGLTFSLEFGQKAMNGIASPTDLRNTRTNLVTAEQAANDKIKVFLNNYKYDETGRLDPIDPQTGISKKGRDFSMELEQLISQKDSVERERWNLDKIEADAKRDAGLNPNWRPSAEIIKQAEEAARMVRQDLKSGGPTGLRNMNEEDIKAAEQRAYNNVIDTSNDPNTKAYAKALKENAKSRTVNKGVTTFSKKDTERLDDIGGRILAGDWGFVKATDVATGEEVANVADYGTGVKNIGWTTKNGHLELIYQSGEYDKTTFIPGKSKLAIQAPPELERHLIENGFIDQLDLEIANQVGDNGGNVEVGNVKAEVLIRRTADQYTPSDVVVIFNNGKKRVPVNSKGEAIKLIKHLAKTTNGNN